MQPGASVAWTAFRLGNFGPDRTIRDCWWVHIGLVQHKELETDVMTFTLRAALLIGAFASSAANAECWEGGAYTENLEGVYSQSWWVDNVRSNGDGSCTVDFKGEGKIGDFGGVLTIKCGGSPTWRWEAIHQDYPGKQSVPREALVALSASVCFGN